MRLALVVVVLAFAALAHAEEPRCANAVFAGVDASGSDGLGEADCGGFATESGCPPGGRDQNFIMAAGAFGEVVDSRNCWSAVTSGANGIAAATFDCGGEIAVIATAQIYEYEGAAHSADPEEFAMSVHIGQNSDSTEIVEADVGTSGGFVYQKPRADYRYGHWNKLVLAERFSIGPGDTLGLYQQEVALFNDGSGTNANHYSVILRLDQVDPPCNP